MSPAGMHELSYTSLALVCLEALRSSSVCYTGHLGSGHGEPGSVGVHKSAGNPDFDVLAGTRPAEQAHALVRKFRVKSLCVLHRCINIVAQRLVHVLELRGRDFAKYFLHIHIALESGH